MLNYEVVGRAIILEFADHRYRYVYDEISPGAVHVRAMIQLAMRGKGLTTYVNQRVRENYAAKVPL